MTDEPTPENARQSLSAHVAARGAEIRAKHGPVIGWNEFRRLLADRDSVRYPCEIAFDAEPLEDGELAYPQPLGDRPEDGFRLCLHPYFATEPDSALLIAAYQLVAINYGSFASPEDAETFGATVLGLDRNAYYRRLCDLADTLHPPATEPAESGCAGTCSCQGH